MRLSFVFPCLFIYFYKLLFHPCFVEAIRKCCWQVNTPNPTDQRNVLMGRSMEHPCCKVLFGISKTSTSPLTLHGGVPGDVLSDVLSEGPLQELPRCLFPSKRMWIKCFNLCTLTLLEYRCFLTILLPISNGNWPQILQYSEVKGAK